LTDRYCPTEVFCQNQGNASPARRPTTRRWQLNSPTPGTPADTARNKGEALGIKVFLADDHRLLVAGFRDVLKDYGIDVIEVAYSLDGLVDRFLEIKPDVLVIDVRFDSKGCGENGLDICEELLHRDPLAKIIVFSQFDDPYIIERSYRLGVLSFVRKDESTEVLDEAIRTVASGTEYFSPEIARLLAISAVKDRNPSRLLDENEMRAFALSADGASLTEIAAAMDFSTKTVGLLMKSVKAKLGVESQADITKLAIRHGITTTALKTKN
jgi:two-component system invasion response regulator UvrY